MKNQLLRLRDWQGQIKFAADAMKDISDVQVMRTGAWVHPYYGPMIITSQTLADMVKNFNDRVRRQDLPVDYFHESDREAAGWFQSLEVFTSESGVQELWGKVKWTPKAQKMLVDGEVKYFSADFYFEWTDPETGVSYKNVLNGGGLVNRPFIKDMEPVAELSEGNEQMKNIEQLTSEIKALKETHADEIAKLGEQVKSKDSEIAALKAEKAVMLKEKEVAAKEAKFADLCAKGKACAAQKEAYMAGDMEKFAELAEKLNTTENGGAGDEEKKTARALSEDEKKMCAKLGLTEEEFLKYNA